MTQGIIATFHGVEVPPAPHFGPKMIQNLQRERYEHREVEAALALISDEDRVIEMGAGAGVVGAAVARNCRPQRIVSFEANPKLLSHIRALYDHNALTEIIEVRHQIVLSEPDAPETVPFYVLGNFLGSGMTITKDPARAERHEIPVVPWEPLKEELAPTALVMDIEGAELEFFRHADLSGIRVVIIEVHRQIYERTGIQEIRKKLTDAGFKRNEDLSGGGVWALTRD